MVGGCWLCVGVLGGGRAREGEVSDGVVGGRVLVPRRLLGGVREE